MLRGDRRPCLDPPTQHSKLHLDRFGRFRTSRPRLPMQTVPILYDLRENAINARLKISPFYSSNTYVLMQF